jgi:hypothetical protein
MEQLPLFTRSRNRCDHAHQAYVRGLEFSTALESEISRGFHELKTDLWLVQILCVKNELY